MSPKLPIEIGGSAGESEVVPKLHPFISIMLEGRQFGSVNASRFGFQKNFIIVAVVAMALTGCGRSKSPSSGSSVPSTPPPQPKAEAAEPAAAPPAPAPAQPEGPQTPATAAENNDNLRQLNLMVNEYKVTFGKLPRDLHEFVERGYFTQLPAATEGKQYHMNPDGNVVLIPK